ncbi:ABC transporter permease [Candidatus Bathyarchaeota archaeon]|nr:ABC transporter permease [Candidatus Bathyarchaeota archaeon]
MGNLKFRIGFTILSILVILGFAVSPFSPTNTRSWYIVPRDRPPSYEYPLGTSSMGRDILWELCASIRNSLTIAFVTAMIASHIGLFLGFIAGIRGGVIDRILMFITDTFIIIPGLPLLMVVTTVLKRYLTIPTLGMLISIVSWPWPSRQVRSMVLSLRERTFIHTAKLSGMGTFRVIVQELMPYVLGWHLINFTNTILFSIGTESGLAILGLSILDDNTLGVMIYWALNWGYALFRGIWWWLAAPVATLVLVFISFYLVSIGMTEFMHPIARR